MARVVMLLSNAFRPDPRVAREAQALAKIGHQVTIIAWDREGNFPQDEAQQGYHIRRIHQVRTSYGAGPRQIAYLPRFWMAALKVARELEPQVIHCHDLDTLPAGWWLSRQMGAILVYDAHEDYPALMSLYLPRPMLLALKKMEAFLIKRVDAVITASSVLAERLRSVTPVPVITLENVPSLHSFIGYTHGSLSSLRQELGIAADELFVAYIGGFSRNRLLLPLIQAATGLAGVHVRLWGDGHQRTLVETAAAASPNVRYLGWLSQAEVPRTTLAADVIYYCLWPDYPGAVYNAPNTLANAMAAGRPILANAVGDLGRIVKTTGCGVLLDNPTAATIRQALLELKDPALRQRLGEKGRLAAEKQYNWQVVASHLEELYQSLLSS